MKRSYVKRSHYLNKIIPFIGKDLIKVIVGQRRVGKSYLLFQIIDEIKAKDSQVNIIYINKEQHQFENIKEAADLVQYV